MTLNGVEKSYQGPLLLPSPRGGRRAASRLDCEWSMTESSRCSSTNPASTSSSSISSKASVYRRIIGWVYNGACGGDDVHQKPDLGGVCVQHGLGPDRDSSPFGNGDRRGGDTPDRCADYGKISQHWKQLIRGNGEGREVQGAGFAVGKLSAFRLLVWFQD